MFEKFFHKGRTQAGHEQEKTTPPITHNHTGNTILFLYDERDSALWYDLAPHINTLVLRYPDTFEWKYYLYAATRTQSQEKHEAFVHDLEKALLFLPCTSATFLMQFFLMIQKDACFVPLLTQTSVQPIPLRAAHGVKQSLLERPLAAYSPGHERDEACTQVVALLEQKLLGYQRKASKLDTLPVVLLEETSSQRLLASLTHQR